VLEFRVTKYDPALRDASGAFTGDEWTSFDDIGETFSGVTLSGASYRCVEDSYVAAATAFMREAGVKSLVIAGLERGAEARPAFSEAWPWTRSGRRRAPLPAPRRLLVPAGGYRRLHPRRLGLFTCTSASCGHARRP